MSDRALSLICVSLFPPFSSISPPAVSTSPPLLPPLLPPLYLIPLLPFRERMKLPFMNDQCEQMLKICNEFVRLQVSYDEYLCMKVLLLLSTGNGTHFSLKKKKKKITCVFQTSATAIILGLKRSSKSLFPLYQLHHTAAAL